MRYYLLKKSALLFMSFIFVGLFAQESINSAGGEASGTGGSVSYSFGQVFYETNSGDSASEAQGVQQPYEIYILNVEEIDDLNSMASVYPNPTADYLILDLKGFEITNFNYQILDMNGRIIQSNKITNIQTKINMRELPSATYLIKVSDGVKNIRTFKIIKK